MVRCEEQGQKSCRVQGQVALCEASGSGKAQLGLLGSRKDSQALSSLSGEGAVGCCLTLVGGWPKAQCTQDGTGQELRGGLKARSYLGDILLRVLSWVFLLGGKSQDDDNTSVIDGNISGSTHRKICLLNVFSGSRRGEGAQLLL